MSPAPRLSRQGATPALLLLVLCAGALVGAGLLLYRWRNRGRGAAAREEYFFRPVNYETS